MDLISLLFIYLTSLSIITYYRRQLTYKGVYILLFINNFILLVYCTYFWRFYVIAQTVENFSFKLNSATWSIIQYNINLKINILSFLFIFLVAIIGCATTIYVFNYFKYEERGEEFILLLNWFIFSMFTLVSGNNFFTLIIGWELIGLTSFLLINFWKFKMITLASSIKAFVFNKISDMFLMLSFCLLKIGYNDENIDSLLITITLNKTVNNDLLFWSGLCLLICCSIKSAQIIGHLWLPDSMEAPVPASALIHSATLVSAGIYLILKFYVIFIITNLTTVIFSLGAITACYGGIVAASQSDLKKILAYSTISHCGFIFTSISLNNFFVTITYLYLHGLFKALTFFCAGLIIKYNNTQDTRLMGANKLQTFNTMALIASSINLGGLPFTFGYLYKSNYLSYLTISNFNCVGYGLCILGMITSVVYVYKLIYYSCFDFRKGSYQTIVYYIQNFPQLLKDKFNNFTISSALSFWLLFIYAIIFFIISKFYISKIYIHLVHTGEVMVDEFSYLGKLFFLKKHLVSIYYICFKLTVFVLVLNNNRTNYFYLEKFALLTRIFSFICFYTLINFMFKYLYIFINLF